MCDDVGPLWTGVLVMVLPQLFHQLLKKGEVAHYAFAQPSLTTNTAVLYMFLGALLKYMFVVMPQHVQFHGGAGLLLDLRKKSLTVAIFVPSCPYILCLVSS